MEAILWLFVGAFIAYWGIPYLRESAKQQAVLDRLQEVTTIVEGIRHENELAIEALKGRSQLRFLAAERRLEAHQRAFALWVKLRGHLFEDDIGSVVMECQDFWIANNLYIDSKVRDSFARSYRAAEDHRSLVHMYRGTGSAEGRGHIKASFDLVMKTGNEIVKAIELPPLAERDWNEFLGDVAPEEASTELASKDEQSSPV